MSSSYHQVEKKINFTSLYNLQKWLLHLIMHVFAVYAFLVILNGNCHWGTTLAAYLEILISTVSIIAGAHSLWAHQTYQATLPLR